MITATARERRIPSIQLTHLQHALAEFSRMDLAQQERLADELHERQPNLLAFVIAHLGDAGLLGIGTDAEKFIVLAVLNLVECVGDIASSAPSL